MNALEKTFPGFLDSRLVEPITGNEWTILLRFDCKEHIDNSLHARNARL